MSLYLKYVSMHLKSQMSYKMSFFFTVFGQLFSSFATLLGIWFIFARFHEIGNFQFEEILLCFATILLAFSLAECFGRGFDEFPTILSNGEFDRILVRPKNILLQILGAKMEFSRVGRMLQALLVFCYAIPSSSIQWTASKGLTLILMIICGACLFFLSFMLQASIAFFTIESLEFMNIFTDGVREFGRYPISIYGKNVLKILTYIVPVAWVQYYPFLYLIGRVTNPLWSLSPLVSLLFALPVYFCWQIGLKNYKSTGS